MKRIWPQFSFAPRLGRGKGRKGRKGRTGIISGVSDRRPPNHVQLISNPCLFVSPPKKMASAHRFQYIINTRYGTNIAKLEHTKQVAPLHMFRCDDLTALNEVIAYRTATACHEHMKILRRTQHIIIRRWELLKQDRDCGEHSTERWERLRECQSTPCSLLLASCPV